MLGQDAGERAEGGRTVELKLCPFCGGEAEFNCTGSGMSGSEVKFNFNIRCKKCDIIAPLTNGYLSMRFSRCGESVIIHDDRTKAADTWNRRVNDE